MNSPHLIPEQQISPADGYEWTPADKREAAQKLVGRITNGEPWDENCTGWKGDLHATYDNIMFRYKTTKLGMEEAMLEMSIAFDDHVERHAKDEVEHDPNRYCEIMEEA